MRWRCGVLAGGGLAHVFVFISGHGQPLLRNLDQLLLDKGIARLFGVLLALSRLGAVLVCLGCQIGPPSVR
jgi:hypothetical protein